MSEDPNVVKDPVVQPQSTLSNTGHEVLEKMIGDLRDENANRRVKNKELAAANEGLQTKLEELSAKIDNTGTKAARIEELEKIVQEFEKLKIEKQQAEMTEIEKLKDDLLKRESQIADRQKKYDKESKELINKLAEKDAINAGLINRIEESRIKTLVAQITQDKSFKFRSPYERTGLFDEVLNKKESGEFYTDEEVTEIVTKFVDENLKAPDAPPGQQRTTTTTGSEDMTSVVATFNKLSQKRKSGIGLTTDESKELSEVMAKIEEFNNGE
jgi:hypothetical protein